MALANKKRLGKSLESLISTYTNTNSSDNSEIDIESIVINREQPRKVFDEEKLSSLKKSIKEKGILQPILVRKFEDKYQIIAGERRFRAAKSLGLEKIPVIIKKIDNIESLELAIIENIERENLNPIEEIEAFKLLLEKYNYTHKQLAEKFNQDRSTMANKLRILNLPQNIKEAIATGIISLGHGRALLSANEKIQNLFKLVVDKNLSVRALEKLVQPSNIDLEAKNNKIEKASYDFKNYEEKFKKFFNNNVKISFKKDKGKIEINFKNLEELKKILRKVKN